MTINYAILTKDQAGKLSPQQAKGMLGPWWSGNEGIDRLDTEEGRQQLHRVWLRYTFNSDSKEIPAEVLKSHALEPPALQARDWFARELFERFPGDLEDANLDYRATVARAALRAWLSLQDNDSMQDGESPPAESANA